MFQATDYDKLQQIMAESPEKKELLTRLLESQKMTISTISHEIRNPLTLVYSTLQMIESQHPEVLTYKHWSGMRADVEYMTQLLEELSSYNNGERLNRSSIETNTFLKTLSLSFASSIVDSDIIFTSKIQPGLPAVSGDPVKLRQVLLNLLANARDAVMSLADTSVDRTCTGSSDGYTPSIRLEATLTADGETRQDGETSTPNPRLLVSITDNGCGIAPEYMETLFEPFVTHKSGGTGLGLAIAARIAKAHGGTLTLSSTPGIGSTFYLTLPV